MATSRGGKLRSWGRGAARLDPRCALAARIALRGIGERFDAGKARKWFSPAADQEAGEHDMAASGAT
jgi:hypothetical protein